MDTPANVANKMFTKFQKVEHGTFSKYQYLLRYQSIATTHRQDLYSIIPVSQNGVGLFAVWIAYHQQKAT